MSDDSEQRSWTQSVAMAIPKGGYVKDKVEQGRYGPIFPKTPTCYGFSILAKVIPGREERFYEHAKHIEGAVAAQPDCLAVLKLHYLKWLLFPIKGETYFMYQGIFDTDFDKYTEDAVALFGSTGLTTVFENLEGFPADWKTNPSAFFSSITSSFLEIRIPLQPHRPQRRTSRTCSTRCSERQPYRAHRYRACRCVGWTYGIR